MWHDESLDAGSAHRATYSSQVIEESDLGRHVFDARPDFSSFRGRAAANQFAWFLPELSPLAAAERPH
jgi:hypothetical protein